MKTCRLVLRASAIGAALLVSTTSIKAAVGLDIQFVDSATGYAVQADEIIAHPHANGGVDQHLHKSHVGSDGRVQMHLERGRHTIRAELSKYRPMDGEVE